MLKVFRKLVIVLSLLWYGGESEGLQNLWRDGAENAEGYGDFHAKYLSYDGFFQWKADGEYLMSEEFLSEFLLEGGNPDSRSVVLSRYWVGEGLVTAGFDEARGSKWPEWNRDAAIPVVLAMIAVYRGFLQRMWEGVAKAELEGTIKCLEGLVSYFRSVIVIGPEDEWSFKKKEQYR
jgi:hypothetical protein